MMTVMKFGGTSMGSPEALNRATDIIMNKEGSKVVVVSAMSGVTNFLENLINDSASNPEESAVAFRNKHLKTAEEIFDEETMKLFMEEFEVRYKYFHEVITTPFEKRDAHFKDLAISQGERFSSLILAYLLKMKGQDAIAITSEQAGVTATGIPGSGCADLTGTAVGLNVNVRTQTEKGLVVVLTGFYGKNIDGQILTFGRGGSDYSAAIVANALNANILEIWTDVDGFLTADPRIVKNALKIDEMNFGEAAELAYFGAKVLHPRTIEPVRIKHIPLVVKNTFNPEGSGTLIHHLRKPKDDLLRAVAVKTDLSIITISSAEIAYRPIIVAKIIEKIAEVNAIVYAISTSLSTVALLMHNLDVKQILMKLNSLEAADIERIDVKSNVALVCAVGDNLLDKCGVSGDIFTVVKEANANVEMISEGASDVSLNFVVPMDRMVDVVTKLHDKYVGGNI